MQPVTDTPSDDSRASGPAATDGVEALVGLAARLFKGEAFAVSDHRQVGNPVVHASPELESLIGYPMAEYLGRNIGFLMRDDTDQQADVVTRQSLAERRAVTQVVRVYRADGRLLWTEQRHYPMTGEDGRLSSVVTVLADVSERVHAAAAHELGKELNASLDESTYNPPGNLAMGDHPIAWYHTYDGGRAFYTGLGHTSESYANPDFVAHLKGAIEWASGAGQ